MSASAPATSARISSRSSPSSSLSISLAVSRSPVRARSCCGGLHDRPELAVAPGHLLVPALIGDQLRVAEARFEVLVLPLEVSKPIQHRRRGYGWTVRRHDPTRCQMRQSPFDRDELGGCSEAGGEGLG